MVVKQENFQEIVVENMRGGEGQVTFHHVVQGEECLANTQVTARVDFRPGDSIGYHVHQDNSEMYIVIEGEFEVDDNHEKQYTLKAGDVMLTPRGNGHSIANHSEKSAAIWAIVVA